MHIQIDCPLCKGELEKVHSTKDYLVSDDQFDILECSTCQLRLTNPFPVVKEMNKYYESDEYISHSNSYKSLFEQVYGIVRSYMLGRKCSIVTHASARNHGTVLDIGCGAGHFLKSMQDRGWNVQGVDTSPKAREMVKKQFDINVCTPHHWLHSTEKYDLVTCWHSLEHVHAPWEYLQKIKSQLNAGGTLLVALPNYISTDGQKYGADWAAYDTPRHLYHFTPKSMTKIMEQNGFRIQNIHRMPFDAFYVSLLSAGHKGSSVISGIWNGFLSWSISTIIKKKCSSLIYIMQ